MNNYVIAKKTHVSKVDNLVCYDLTPVENAPSLREIVQAIGNIIKALDKVRPAHDDCDCLTCVPLRALKTQYAQLTALEEKA
jgi:hypothetical protein